MRSFLFALRLWEGEPPEIALEAVQLALTLYLGSAEARRLPPADPRFAQATPSATMLRPVSAIVCSSGRGTQPSLVCAFSLE